VLLCVLFVCIIIIIIIKCVLCYRGANKSLARPTSRCILFDGENISFDSSLVICINSTMIINRIINRIYEIYRIINRIYETQNLLSL
jgi:hypothetical protein